MEPLSYQYVFDDMSDRLMPFSVVADGMEMIHSSISLKDAGLFVKLNSPMPPEVADLIDIAVAIFVADWLSFRRQNKRHNIHISLPLRNPEIYESPNITELLTNVLDWYTEDNWFFEFKARRRATRKAEQQLCLLPARTTEVALWSGGLDSLAGAYNRLSSEPNKQFVLFGTGSSSIAYRTQYDVFSSLRTYFPGRIELVRLPINSRDTTNIRKNHQFRVRGFTFLALGAACAYLEGQNTLHIYENGVGAINLPFRASEVGLDHSRGVHPLSLFHMSKLVSALFNSPFQFRNLFLFTTKAEMCSVFNKVNDLNLISQTATCDGPRREKHTQCGMCTSCLLRRQALAAAHIEDRTGYKATATLMNESAAPSGGGSHLCAMLEQVETMKQIVNSNESWLKFIARYPELLDIVDRISPIEHLSPGQMEDKILRLYQQYCKEWDEVDWIVSRGLISDREYMQFH